MEFRASHPPAARRGTCQPAVHPKPRATFAHLQNLRDGGVLGDDVGIVRNPVGGTHEDADDVFGAAHEELKNEDMMDPYELDKHLMAAFKNYNYKLPVTILHVDATFDYKPFYEGHVNSELVGFGYCETEPGSHWLKLSDAMFLSTDTGTSTWAGRGTSNTEIARGRTPGSDRARGCSHPG